MKVSLLALSMISLCFISCKKERTCACSIFTKGSTTTHNQTAGNKITIPPLPPIVIIAPTDTTYVTPYSYTTTQKTNYNKVSKRGMHKNCATSSEENFNDSSVLITPGTSTVTTTKAENRTYSCKIE